ncbi:MAG: UbiD family decarboxylase [Sulfolobales archaeon]|nr:UbiD family decarboxylase [Sulfolobales archaeon]MCX8198666.1 UbiD family decarboxylase [Sulfolobales archaeon]MDW8169739.1 UbiD family decarboxylase [Desulfurococcaceae archaeon]
MNCSDYFKALASLRDFGEIPGDYEITRLAHRVKEPFKARVHGIRLGVYSNLISSRELIYKYMGVNRDCEAYEKLINAIQSPLKPSFKEFSSFFTEVEIDLRDLPFIRYYREDGGSYLTGSIFISCIDDICNASFHRVMRINGSRAAVRIVPRHLYRIYMSYRERGEDAPVAVVLGSHPLVELASAASPPYGVYEMWVANKLLEDRLNLVYTPIYELPVPTCATVILEGVITGELHEEGPFVDILGIPDQVRMQPVFKFEKAYINVGLEYPLIHAIVPGLEEHILLMGFPREASIWDSVRRIHSDVRSVRLTRGSGGWLHAIVSIKKSSEGDVKNVVMAAFTGHPSLKHVIVVDEDIDVDDPYSVEWAIATRFQASRGLIVIKGSRGSTLDPSSIDGLTDKVGVDATKPVDRDPKLFKRVGIP